jgi:hypothetical protein
MDVVRTHPREVAAAGGTRRGAPLREAGPGAHASARATGAPLHAARHARHAALAAVLAALVFLLLAAEAQAYVPGQLIWAKRIGTSAGEAAAWAVAAGPNGVTAIAGWKSVAPTGQVPMVARFTATGRKWGPKTYTALGTGRAEGVAIDKSGNVYVAATLDQREGDIVVLKYSPGGTFLWATEPYDGTGGGSPDRARAIAVDGAGDVIVAGTSVVNGTGLEGIVVLKYRSDNGNMKWAHPGGIVPSGADPNEGAYSVNHLALGGAGDIYVAGSQQYKVGDTWNDYALVMKLNGGDGGSGGPIRYKFKSAQASSFESIAVRGYRVAAAGSTWNAAGGNERGLVAAYDLNLAPYRSREWVAGGTTQEWFGDVVLDGKGNVYVTGDQWVPNKWGKTVTMKLTWSLAKIFWKPTYYPTSKDAEAWYIARDSLGNIYVSGVKNSHVGRAACLTLKYSPTGVRKWVKSWSGGGPGDTEPSGLVLGTKGGVYVGGEAKAKGDVLQAMLLKYQR